MGYGDIVPSHHRVAFACFFLVTVVVFAYLLGESVALVTETKRYHRMDEFFGKGMTPEILDAMDIFRDGQVLPCLLYTSPSPRDRTRSRMPSSA